MTATSERAQRVAQVWKADPHLTEREVDEIVDAELALEAEQRAEGARRATEFADSFAALTTCAVPGCRHGKLPTTALCEAHSRVLYVIEAEAAAGEKLPDGRLVRDWIAELVAARQKAS